VSKGAAGNDPIDAVARFGGPLPRAFYDRPTSDVAQDLLGTVLVRLDGDRSTAARIVETEAYFGEDDEASHGAAGLTARTRIMYGEAGHAYVYFIYGTHDMLNVSTEREGYPAAVLVRAAEPLVGLEIMAERRSLPGPVGLTNGPGRLCRAMGITLGLNGADMTVPAAPLYVAPRDLETPSIVRATRVGITRARDRLQRFYIEGNPHVSRR
jgi:DNA-3-methyladenine glycosylase